MKKAARNLVIFGVIIAALIGAYFLVNRLESSNEEENNQNTTEIFSVEKDKIAELTLSNSGESFTFVQKDKRWTLKDREHIELEQGKVDNLAYDAAKIDAVSVVDENPAELSAFGLDEPRGSFSLLLTDGTSKTFLIGSLTPTQGHYYFKDAEQSAVYTMNVSKAESLLRRLNAFRPKTVISLEKKDIRRVEILPANGEAAVYEGKEKPGASEEESVVAWEITSPFRRDLSNERFDSLVLMPLSQITAQEIIDDSLDNLQKFGLDKPASTVKVTDKNGATHTLQIGTANGATYVIKNGAPPVWSVAEANLGFKDVSPIDVVIRLATTVNLADLEKAVITAGSERTEISVRRDGQREVFLVDGSLADETAFRDFYKELAGIGFDNVLKGAADRSEIKVSIKYTLTDGNTRTVEFAEYDNLNYAIFEDGTALFTTKRKTVTTMLQRLDELKAITLSAQ